MATTHTDSSSRKTRTQPQAASVRRYDGRSVKRPEGIAFLMQQHRDVEKLFEQYEAAEDEQEKSALSAKICLMLAVHAKIEEELLYPEAAEMLEDSDLVDQARVEHASAKDLIAQIETMQVAEPLYDAKVKVLKEYIKHHVEEEENELFPELMRSDFDFAALGRELTGRSSEVESELSEGGEDAARSRIAAEAEAGARI